MLLSAKRLLAFACFLICLLTGRVIAQNARPHQASPNAGMPVLHPESLSGPWEAPDGSGGAIGIHLILITTVKDDLAATSGAPELWAHLSLGVFQRHGNAFVFGDTNYFTDDSEGAAVRVEHGRLRLHFASPTARLPSVDLDLEQRGQIWRGRLHRGPFDSIVMLQRPGAGLRPMSPLTGSWREHDSMPNPNFACVHIAQQTPKTFVGWSDSIYVPGQVNYPANSKRPMDFTNVYGDRLNVQRERSGAIRLELGAFNPICCSRTFVGKLVGNQATLLGEWVAGLNQFRREASWTKMPGNSCPRPGK